MKIRSIILNFLTFIVINSNSGIIDYLVKAFYFNQKNKQVYYKKMYKQYYAAYYKIQNYQV